MATMSAPYHKTYKWFSHAKSYTAANEHVIEVCPGPHLRPPEIPLNPVQLDEEGNIAIKGNIAVKGKHVVPWQLVSWPSQVRSGEEEAATESSSTARAHSNSKQAVWGAFSPSKSESIRGRTKSSPKFPTTVASTVQCTSQGEQTSYAMHMGHAMHVHKEPVRFTIPWLGSKGECATTVMSSENYQENNSNSNLGSEGFNDNASNTKPSPHCYSSVLVETCCSH